MRQNLHHSETIEGYLAASFVIRSGFTALSMCIQGSPNCRASSSDIPPKLITHRLGDWLGELFKSSPLRYGNNTLALRESRSMSSCAISGASKNPAPSTSEPWKH